MEEEEDGDEICKVVLLGESGVGKTSIISRFTNGTFEESLMSTNGASYVCRNLTFPEYENRMIRYEVWDTAGQEQYRALNKIFYKDASICILVYDISNFNSFNALKDYWHHEILDVCPKNIVLGLAANKSDLFEREAVSEENARNFAKEIDAIFMYTSASKFIGIDELFYNVGCKYIDPDYKLDGNKANGESGKLDNKINKDKDNKTNKNKKEEKNKKIKVDEKNNKKVKKKGCC
jgi:small GTP-binding protein